MPGDADLGAILQDKMRVDQKAELLIISDAAAYHETVVKVVDAANQAGMQKVRLTTRGGTALPVPRMMLFNQESGLRMGD